MPSAKVKRVLEEIDTFSQDELNELIKELQDKRELFAMLRAIESTFSDWDNEEDDVYNDL